MFLEVKDRPIQIKPPPLYEPWRKCLYDAAARVDSAGWDNGPRCPLNHIFAVGGDGVETAVHRLVCVVGNVINWNGAPGQTAESVAKTMRLVAST